MSETEKPSSVSENEQTGVQTPAREISDDVLNILPVRNLVLFPGIVLPVGINREMTIAGAQEATRSQRNRASRVAGRRHGRSDAG